METVKSKADFYYLLNYTVAVQRRIRSALHRPDHSFYLSFEDLVLQAGTYHEPAPIPHRWLKRPMKRCFVNSYHLSARYGFKYFEGFASTGDVPILHAWNTTRFGRLVDSTWTDLLDEGKVIGYLGIEIPFNIVELATDVRGYHGVFDDWRHRYPILQEKWDYASFVERLERIKEIDNGERVKR